MFQSFPLGDKSSVNLRGNFHVENVTTFEDFLKDSSEIEGESKSEELTVKFGASNVRKNEGPATMDIDSLYPVFWSLQNSFSNPPLLFEEEHFKHFQKSLEATLAKFKEVPKVIQAGDPDRKRDEKENASDPGSKKDEEESAGDSGPRKDEKESAGDNYDAFANTYNPKYLTSRDLFKLEVRNQWQLGLGRYD
jgi:THO complex subunit 1